MIFNWFKKKEPENLPDFWCAYAKKFDQELPERIADVRFVVLDTETTGFDYKEDRMLSIGAVSVQHNQIDMADNFEIYIDQEKFNPESVKIHGIIRNEKVATLSEEEAVKEFLKYIENAVLVAHHANFDITMINKALKRMGLPKLKNRILDTVILYRKTRIISNLINRDKNYSLDEIAEAYTIDVSDRHTAAGDAFITAIAFLKIMSRLNKNGQMGRKSLFRY
ncbi:3'-5' exonuclease [Salegentibacter sp. F188]|uniref:3'-5' exonuclease n=1 Tax=Autumnicola patrickiae TaxID=3075591 RepID=A0ABU3E367_9FLAO|nr:3'-5' exonuclease [Salegentibacter sp. F188]MDT0690343.1 3'-5' exonuclease [Salegentibacter sp. F188]